MTDVSGACCVEPIHVLVVDDSAVVRQFLSGLLSRQTDMSVAVAADPLIAKSKMKQRRPDVIVLDLEMPRMDGLTFLRQVMAEDPIAVVVCSGHAGEGTVAALRALEEGAVEVLAKPQLGLRDFLHDSAETLIETIRAAAQARLRRSSKSVLAAAGWAASRRPGEGWLTVERVVAIGASTGGPEAIREILEVMPADAPGIVIVQHMPAAFTPAFARRLDENCRIEVREAVDGDGVTKGRALIAPGDRHLTVVREATGFAVRTSSGPPVCRHRPSVDVLFRSMAKAIGKRGVGVLLTGMGKDGAAGLGEMRRAGAATVAQDEASSVVFGMPREAIVCNAAESIVPLPAMAEAILRRACWLRPAGDLGAETLSSVRRKVPGR